MTTASLFSLGRRIEVFAMSDANVLTSDQYHINRLVSYDNGNTWVGDWVLNVIGTFSSPVATSITGDSLDTFLVGKGQDQRFWFTCLSEYYNLKQAGFNPIGQGIFHGKPALCSYGNSKTTWHWQSLNNVTTSYKGVTVLVFGRGTDDRIWWAYSTNGGSPWDMAWKPLVEHGTFTSSPAAACSADGLFVSVFGIGQDKRMWWAYSTSGGSSWDMAWDAIGQGVFTSSPAAVCSADGKRIYAFAKGNDNRFWWAYATNGVQGWDMAWDAIGQGVFKSPPSASCSWDGQIIHVFGKGMDDRIWQARSEDFGHNWSIAWRRIHDMPFPDIDI
jgi:hypothetical protein